MFLQSSALACLALAASTASHAQTELLAGLDRYVERAMSDWQTPGLAVAVVRNDSVVFIKGYGVREQGKPAPINADTVFALSSNGKAFTAAVAGIMVDEGKLSWDSPVFERLPDFRLHDSWVSRMATIRDLLGHRISGDTGATSESLWALTTLSRGELIRRLRFFEPGPDRFRDRYSYRNLSILAAGQAAAAAAGTSWDELVTSRVLWPLEMTSATTSVLRLWNARDVAACYMCELDYTPGNEQARISNIVMPHLSTERGPKPIPWRNVDNVGPAGSINANIRDVANWVRMQLAQGMFQSKRIVSSAALAQMHTPQMLVPDPPYPAGPGFGHFWAYGLGWFIGDYQGRKLVMHTGEITGFKSAIVLLPEENLGVAVLANSNEGTIPHNLLSPALPFVIFDRLLSFPQRDWSAAWRASVEHEAEALRAAEQQIVSLRVSGTKPSIPVQHLLGSYVHPAFGELVVEQHDGKLGARLNGLMTAGIEHWHYDLYRLTWTGPTPITGFMSYSVDPQGHVERLRIEGLGEFARESNAK